FLHAPSFSEEEAFGTFAAGLDRLTAGSGVSSSHVLFVTEAEAAKLERTGLLRRYGVQFHWRNAGYTCFEDFLARFSSKRRNQIRRERRGMGDAGLELSVHAGDELGSENIDHVYAFYASTVDKHFYGRRYLNREFFHELCARMPRQVLVVLAREK